MVFFIFSKLMSINNKILIISYIFFIAKLYDRQICTKTCGNIIFPLSTIYPSESVAPLNIRREAIIADWERSKVEADTRYLLRG